MPSHVVTFTLISNLVTDFIQKRRAEPGLFSFEYNPSPKLIKVTTWIGHMTMIIVQKNQNLLQTKFDPIVLCHDISYQIYPRQKRAEKYVSNSKTTWVRSICKFRNGNDRVF